MRDILFRGKRKDNGEWVVGYYVMVDPVDMPARHRKPKAVIFPERASCNWFNKYFYHAIEVLPETVGQFTGMTDKDSTKIFEGDIVTGSNFFHEDRIVHRVVYEDGGFYFQDEDDVAWNPEHVNNVRVVGNIYDDSELLEDV